MCLLRRSPTAWSPGSTSGDFIFNLAIAHSGKLEIGTRQLNNWRLHVPPDFLPLCQPGALSTHLHCSRMPRHHTRPPGRYTNQDQFLLQPNFSPVIFYAFVSILHQDCTKTIISLIHQFCYQGKKKPSHRTWLCQNPTKINSFCNQTFHTSFFMHL